VEFSNRAGALREGWWFPLDGGRQIRRRRNTTTEVLEHYEIIDLLNRGTLPDVTVNFILSFNLQ